MSYESEREAVYTEFKTEFELVSNLPIHFENRDFDPPDTVQEAIGYLSSDIHDFKNGVEKHLDEMSDWRENVGRTVSQIMVNTEMLHFGLFVISILLSLILWRVW